MKTREQNRYYAERWRRAHGIMVRPVKPWHGSGLPKSTFYYRRKVGLPLISAERYVEQLVVIARKQLFARNQD
jgi:hypothetical protein